MALRIGAHNRNLFEIENARNLNVKELVDTFVPTESFWRLLSAKHHVILGSRGSGKTALAKMLSHDHLALLNKPRAQSAILEQQFIGVYVPTRLEWVGALKNKTWQDNAQKEDFFQWKLNLATCLALITTLQSCIKCYAGSLDSQAVTEQELARQLSLAWGDGVRADDLETLTRYLEDISWSKDVLIASLRARGEMHPNAEGPGTVFSGDLFAPLKRGITLATRLLQLRHEATWLICLDEAEFLDELHQRIINSHMRAYSGNIFFKVTTMPYCHYTLATNTSVSLNVGHDFEYVYIDTDPTLFKPIQGERTTFGTAFGRTLFSKRLSASKLLGSDGRRLGNMDKLLGKSELLDEKLVDWSSNPNIMSLLETFASPKTYQRACSLLGTARFNSEIARKIHGALILCSSVASTQGRGEIDVYSGTSMAIRCGDANPRRMIRIFNRLLLPILGSMDRRRKLPKLDGKQQTRVLKKLSTATLVTVQSEPLVGPELYALINYLGTYMRRMLHEVPLSTDQVASVEIEPSISDEHWNLIKAAVQLGLLYPNLGPQEREELPIREGTFHLAFILAPHFDLLPRRGSSRRLSTILRGANASAQFLEQSEEQFELNLTEV